MSASSTASEQILETLLQSAVSQVFPAGSILITDGQVADAVYYVVRGRVAIVKGGVEVNTQGEGSVLGEIGVLMGQPRSSSVVCVTDVETLRVEASDFLRVGEDYPAFMRSIFTEVVAKLQGSDNPNAPIEGETEERMASDSRRLGNDTLLQLLKQRQEATRQSCWHRIGVWGDASCPELNDAIHCRNCHVFATAGRKLFQRRPAREYVQQWTEALARPKQPAATDAESVVVFRLGQEWLALRAHVFQEVTEARAIHTLPHRTNRVLLGLVNVRGELLLCFSLAELLGISAADPPPHTNDRRAQPRFAVVEVEGQRWVFAADEIQGIHELSRGLVQNPPVTVSKAGSSFTSGMFTHQEKSVAVLDEDLVFFNLKKNCL